MNSTTRRALRAAVPVLALSLALSACSAAEPEPSVDPDAPVTITVSNQPPASQEAELAAYLQVIEDFEAEYPNITVEGVETGWDPQTFQAQLAGGQLPNVMVVPFTEPQGMIARGQLADITDELEQLGLKDMLNPSASAVGQDAEGRFYGVPIDAYALGLAYNREIFEQAGLDPDDPPTTWEEVREAAKTIADATRLTGYAHMTTGGQGGWMLTAMTYAAVKFIAFRLQTYLDEDAAVEAAQASFEAGMPVGLPGLSALKDDYRDQYLEWVADYVNVPLENFATYEATVNTIPLRPEPAARAQEVYATLDSVVQAVLTDRSTDIPALLETTQSNLEALLAR